MRKVVMFIVLIAVLFVTGALRAQSDEIVLSDPAKLTTEEYRALEHKMLLGSGGSSGYHLGPDEIAWLKKGRRLHPAAERDDDGTNLHNILGQSLEHMHRYREAMLEYREAGMMLAAEEMDWLVHNPGMQNGGVPKLNFVPGRLPMDQLGTAKVAEVEDRVFVAEFKGGLFLDDKARDRHAVIFVPEDQYDWLTYPEFNGKTLTSPMHLSDRRFEYDPDANVVKIRAARHPIND